MPRYAHKGILNAVIICRNFHSESLNMKQMWQNRILIYKVDKMDMVSRPFYVYEAHKHQFNNQYFLLFLIYPSIYMVKVTRLVISRKE